MPDRLDANGYVIPDPEHPHLDPHAIAHCHLCDDDGYHRNRVCDHVDHYADTTHGRAAVAAELQKIRDRRKGTPA